MGVVHKLREDIIDFILEQKEARPQLSCRKLSEIVSAKFHLDVSKSSVSTILKNAHLNSPVGRHSVADEDEKTPAKKVITKFKIPEHKKKQIFTSSQSVISRGPRKEHKIENKIAVPRLPKNNVEKLNVNQISTKARADESVRPVEMSNLKSPSCEKKSTSFLHLDRAGTIFLKAAEWDIAGGSLLAKIIKDELGGRFDVNFEYLSDLLLFPELFDNKNSSPDDQIRKNHFLNIAPNNDLLNPQIYSSLITAVNNIQHSGLKLSIELEVVSRGAAVARINNRNGDTAFLSMRNKCIGLDNVQSESVSLPEALQGLGAGLLNNVHSGVFHFDSDLNTVDEMTAVLMRMCQNEKNEGLKDIVLYDSQGLEIMKCNYFPGQMRSFVLAVWRWKELWSKVSSLTNEKYDFSALPVLGKTFYYRELSPHSLKNHCRALSLGLSPSSTEEPIVILLTNVEKDIVKTQKAVIDFLYTWPDLTNDDGSCFMSKNNDQKESLTQIMEHVKDIENADALPQTFAVLRKAYAQWVSERFFALKENSLDDNALLESVLQLSGSIGQEFARTVSVYLEVPAGYKYIDLLKIAVDRLNSRMLSDPSGRRLIIRITHSAHHI